jgi:hypothetical protein
MAQMSLGGELDKADLRHQSWFDPLHFVHLVGRDSCTPMGCLAGGEIDEWTFWSLQRIQRVKYFSAHMRRKARPDLAGISKLFALVVADDECIDPVIAGAVATDDEFLLLVELQLDPRAASL